MTWLIFFGGMLAGVFLALIFIGMLASGKRADDRRPIALANAEARGRRIRESAALAISYRLHREGEEGK